MIPMDQWLEARNKHSERVQWLLRESFPKQSDNWGDLVRDPHGDGCLQMLLQVAPGRSGLVIHCIIGPTHTDLYLSHRRDDIPEDHDLDRDRMVFQNDDWDGILGWVSWTKERCENLMVKERGERERMVEAFQQLERQSCPEESKQFSLDLHRLGKRFPEIQGLVLLPPE